MDGQAPSATRQGSFKGALAEAAVPEQPAQPAQIPALPARDDVMRSTAGVPLGPQAAARVLMPELPQALGGSSAANKASYAAVSAQATSERASLQPTVQSAAAEAQLSNVSQFIPADQDPFLFLARDHDTLRQLMKEYRAAMQKGSSSAAVEARAALIPMIVAGIVTHASAEEQCVHELYRSKLGQEHGQSSQELGDRGSVPAAGIPSLSSRTAGVDVSVGELFFEDSLRVDQANKDALYALEHAQLSTEEGVRAADAAFEIVDAIEADHLRLEDTVYFPALRAAMTAEEMVTLHQRLVHCKAWAPTHAHPAAPDKPLLAKITHPLAGLLDRARDALLGPKQSSRVGDAGSGQGQGTTSALAVQLYEGR